MFDQVPNQRITQRRRSLKDAVVAMICLAAGGFERFEKGRVGWETAMWGVVFVLSAYGYWRGRHEDPWNPPLNDANDRGEPRGLSERHS